MNRSEIERLFNACKDKDEAHKLYLKLMRQWHPDKGGDLETCKLINEIHDKVMKRPLFGTDPEDPEDEGSKFDWSSVSQGIYEQLMKVIQIDSLEVEICGRWIWIGGDTRENKETLKAAGFRFSRNKCKWYWHEGKFYKHKSSRNYTMDEIRFMHGSQRVGKERRKSIKDED